MPALSLATLLTTLAAGLDLVVKAPPREPPADPPNTYDLPEGEDVAAELIRWFRRQLADLLGTVPTIGADVPLVFPDLADYDDPMAAAMTPLLSAYWDQGGRQVRERLGLDPDAWQVTNPHTRAKIEQAALAFCNATNRTTSQNLNDALAALRAELAEGIVERGDSLPELRKRVQTVFDKAEAWRAQRIAASEASRAVHAAELQSAEESGVVAGMEWLASEDACDVCQQIAREAGIVRLGHAFAHIGTNPHYSRILHPPAHPGCQCSMVEVLRPEYGGPENPEFKPALDQPQGDPEGKPVEPRPEARKPKPAWMPADTVADAREFALRLGVRQVDYADRLDIANRTNECLADMARRGYPMPDGVMVSETPADFGVPELKPGIPAAFKSSARKNVGALMLNPAADYWKDPAGEARRFFERGVTSSPDEHHPIRHEFGHYLHWLKDLEHYLALGRRAFTPTERAVARRVSFYAHSRPREFVAEVWAGRLAGRTYDADVAALYAELEGPKS